MTVLPEPKPVAPAAGQATPTDADREQIRRLVAAVDEIEQPTRYDNPDLPAWKDGSRIGTTPPVPQPGRPPMSQRAVDLNTTMLSSSVLVAVLGGAATAVMWASGKADPTVIGWICGCAVAVPAAIAIPVLALKGLMNSAKEVAQAAPPEIHNHYNAPVDQREIRSRTSGVWVKNTNQQ